jgi:molybdopterin/thiamine biosynthesis adenylyltransferase
VTVLKPYEDDNPSYRDIFPAPPPDGLLPTCAEAGILGALTGIIGSIQALEVLKLIAGIGEPLVGRLLLYDGLAQRFDEIRYRRRRT